MLKTVFVSRDSFDVFALRKFSVRKDPTAQDDSVSSSSEILVLVVFIFIRVF
jgi:hypothetical protein